MNLTELPDDLKSIIGSETVDFAVKAKRNSPLKSSLGLLLFSIFWCAMVSIPIISGLEKSNPKKATLLNTDNESIFSWVLLLIPNFFTGLFLLVGLLLFIISLVSLFQKGGYFVGTNMRLIHYRNGLINIVDWDQLSGNLKVRNKGNFGDLELQLKTGRIVRRKNEPDEIVPDVIQMCGIPNLFEIEKKCRTRIKENDSNRRAFSET